MMGERGIHIKFSINSFAKYLKKNISLIIYLVCTVNLFYLFLLIAFPSKARITQKGLLLIKAVEKYHAMNNIYPDSLTAIVPEYLKVLPKTGGLVSQNFHYSKDEKTENGCASGSGVLLNLINCDSKEYETGGYVIYVEISHLIFNPDILYYIPNGNYNHHEERIESWAYYTEQAE